ARAPRGARGPRAGGGVGVLVAGRGHWVKETPGVGAPRRPPQPQRHPPRGRGAEDRSVGGHPIGRRRRLVIDDVVDAPGPLLNGGDRGLGRVLDVDETKDPGAVAEDRALLLARLPLGLVAAVARPPRRAPFPYHAGSVR